MTVFRHHSDGLIYLGDDCYPLLWFVQQEPAYTLPAGAIAREYFPGMRHSLYSKDSQWGGELPWIEGDDYLSRVEQYQLAWQAEQQLEVEVESTTNWAQFRSQVCMHSAYFRLVSAAPQNAILNDLLVPLFWGVGEERALTAEVCQVWNAMIDNAPLTESEIMQLNAIATACNIPLSLDSEGRMGAL